MPSISRRLPRPLALAVVAIAALPLMTGCVRDIPTADKVAEACALAADDSWDGVPALDEEVLAARAEQVRTAADLAARAAADDDQHTDLAAALAEETRAWEDAAGQDAAPDPGAAETLHDRVVQLCDAGTAG
ncbi:hypothetical protein [Cellulomonas marina]|uniref:Uncharacterized protein n=1 Tax=Cellulomonas marina TaxID=988821 RepID=A0A1I0X9A2_9CELL|nr:hypothetical protein [Cellulomonas marina]GIG29525.1 hypothetical protein Cma02nite_21250 [Cellulomonas marina]SFA97511.1 hypothetical protein SAMN05421867_104219 [Cellulomonas marina]